MALSPQDAARLDRILAGPMAQLAGLQVLPPTGGVASMPDIPRGGAFIAPAVDYGQAGQLDPAAASQNPVQRGPVPNIPAQLMGGGGPPAPAPAPAMAAYGPMGGAAPGSAAFSPLPQAADRLSAIPPEQMPGGSMLGKMPMPEELMGMSVGLGPGGTPTVSGAAEEEAAYQRALARDAERAAQGLGPYRPGQPDAPKGGLGGLGGFFGSLFDPSTPRGEDFQNMMLGWAAGAGGTWQDSLAGGAKLVAAGRLSRKEKDELAKSTNKTAEWALANGADPGTVEMFLANKDAKGLISYVEERKKGTKRDTKVIGDMLIDGSTGEVIGNYKSQEPGYRMLSPQEAQAVGLSPEKSYQMGPDGKVSGVGESGVTVNVGGGDKGDEALAKAQGEMFSTLVQDGLKAGGDAARINRLEGILNNTPQGGMAWVQQAAGEYGINTEGLSEIQAAQAVINAMVPEQRAPGSGPMSDRDLELFKAALPRIINQPGANALIINTLRGITEYRRKQGEIAAAVATGRMTRQAGLDALFALENPLDGFSAQLNKGNQSQQNLYDKYGLER